MFWANIIRWAVVHVRKNRVDKRDEISSRFNEFGYLFPPVNQSVRIAGGMAAKNLVDVSVSEHLFTIEWGFFAYSHKRGQAGCSLADRM